jgi:hypothetical protein
MRTGLVIRLVTVFFIIIALFLLPKIWGWSGLPAAVIVAVLILTFFLVRWHARHTGYKCPVCDYAFAISATTDFLSPHLSGVKMLKCPRCSRSSWCPEIGRNEISETQTTKPIVRVTPVSGGTSLRLQILIVLLIYCGLWAYTFYLRSSISLAVPFWEIFKIPVVTLILPILQVTFCLYALRHGYRSRLYFVISMFVSFFLVMAIIMQRSVLSQFG